MRVLLRPAVTVPAVLGAALLAALLSLADVRKVFALVFGFQREYLLYFFALMVAYTVVRGVQWHYLLDALGIRVPARSKVFAFAVGELTKSLPIGNYFQNYLLKLSQGTSFGRSAVGTSLILATEVVVSLVAVAALGLGDWTDWLRPAILVGTASVTVAGLCMYRFRNSVRAPVWLVRTRMGRRLLIELEHGRDGARALARPCVLAVETLLSAAYLSTAAVGLFVIVRGLGITSLTIWQVMSIYFFSLAVGLIIPLPIDLGLIELSGIGGLLMLGVGDTAAVAIMLINRVLSTASAVTIALAAIGLLHGEFVASMRSGAGHPTQAGARSA